MRFLDEHQPSGYGGDRDRALDVVRGRIAVSHVMASSAIPVAFPPVEISTPEAAGGWYMDGGVRLNTPLHPAVGLGATRILLVSATATSYGPRPPPTRAGGRIAAEVFERRTSGLGRISELDNWLIGKAIRGDGDDVGRRELLSYLFFDQEYFAAGLELGRKTASSALSRGWQR